MKIYHRVPPSEKRKRLAVYAVCVVVIVVAAWLLHSGG